MSRRGRWRSTSHRCVACPPLPTWAARRHRGRAAEAQATAAATAAKAAKATAAAAENYDEQFARFLKEARSTAAKPGESWGWMTGLSLDQRARRINDLITIRVVESISASGTAD